MVQVKQCHLYAKILIKTPNRKFHTRFQVAPKSTTLIDLELTLNDHYALCYIARMYFGAHLKNLDEGEPILSAAKM